MPAGRPSKYAPAFADQAEKLCKLGATDLELAEFFDVDVRTIYRWKALHEEFCQALKAGKDVADERVERSLYNRAVGYTHEAVKIFMPAGAKEPVYAPYQEHVPPDPTSCIFWLKNRRSEEWRDAKQLDVGVTDALADLIKEVDERRAAARMADPDAIALEGKPSPLRH